MINFYSQVASNLRAKNYTEAEIRSVLEEVHAHVAASGQSPEQDFGTAFEYTDKFEKRAKTSPFRRKLSLAYGLVFVLAALYFIGRLLWPAVDLGVSVGLWGTLGALAVVTLVSWGLSHRVPTTRDGKGYGPHES